MGEEMSGKTGGGKLGVASFEGTLYDKPGMTVEAYAILNSAREDYNANFDVIDETLGARVGSGARDLRIRYDTFLKPRADNGILLGYAVPKLAQNLNEFKAGNAPTPPQEGEPGSELAKGGGYEGWFAHTGDWYRGRAENLDKRAGGKFEHVIDLEKRPSDSDIEKLQNEEFSKLYGFTKEQFLQKDGVTFEKKYGEDKVRFLREHVLKRLTWEEDVMLREIEDSIYTRSTHYGPLADAPTASGIVSRIHGISCGEKVDFSVLASDPEAQTGIILDPDSGSEQRESYWKLVDEKLKDARFMTEENFSKKWEVSKEAFVDEIVPKLHKLYDGFVAATVTRMDAEELKDRYYLSELRGDELVGELLGGTHSITERVTELESQRNKLTRYMAGFSKKRADFEKKVDDRDELRDKRLIELKKEMSGIEHAHPELALVGAEIFEPYAGERAKREQVMKGASEEKTAAYNLKSGRDNPVLTYVSYRNELKEEKRKADALAAELSNLKNTLEKTDVSSLGFGAVKTLLDGIVQRKFNSDIPGGYLKDELNIGELEKLEARINEIGENAPRLDGGGLASEEDNEKWRLWEQKVAEQERLVLPEIGAAKEKWKEQALRVIETELEKQNAVSARLSPDIERVDQEVSYLEKKLGIDDYNRLKARQKELEVEFPIDDKSKSAKVMVLRKLAFDALARAEEKIGKEEYRQLEERRKELKENPDVTLREAALEEIETIEERLGLAPYKKLDAHRKEIESEIQKKLGTGVYKRIKARQTELEESVNVLDLDTHKEYRAFKAHGEKLEGDIRKAASTGIETLEKELGITEYTDMEAAESRLNDRIDELKKTQLAPSYINASNGFIIERKRKEIENKEDSLKKLVGEIEDIENRFKIQGYAGAGLEEHIRYLKENLPRDPALRKLAMKGINSKDVILRGVESIEHDFESAKYAKDELEKEIKALEGGPRDPQLELQELNNLEKAKEQIRLSKSKWMATHGVTAFEKWKDEHGVTAYKRLVEEEKIIEKTRTNDYWALKEAHDTTVKTNATLNAVDLELGHLKSRLADYRQLPELRDMLWGRGKYSDAPISMAVFDGLYKEIEARLPDESKRLVDIARKNIKQRTEWMGSHPSRRKQMELDAERSKFEFEMLSQNSLSFGWDQLAKGGDYSEFGEFLKKGFGVELPEDTRIETADGGKTSLTMSESGVVIKPADGGKRINVLDGDKKIASVDLYNHDELAMLETADGRVEKLMARKDPKTGELVIFPYVRPDIIMKKMYERAHTKSE